MSERLKGNFMGCPYHDDDYEACIQHSGQAPCDVTKQQKEDWQAEALELFASSIRSENDEGRSADLYGMASLMEVSASQFRRQAEEARDE